MSEYVTEADLDTHPGCGDPFCQESMSEALEIVDSIVRREVAKALREFADEQQRHAWEPGDATTVLESEGWAYMRGAADAHNVVGRLADKRAAAIESGGQP